MRIFSKRKNEIKTNALKIKWNKNDDNLKRTIRELTDIPSE